MHRFSAAILICCAALVAGCSGVPNPTGTSAVPAADPDRRSVSADQNLYENLTASTELLTEWRLVNRAGLDGTLSGRREFTLLAPDNDAYQHMPRWAYARLWVEINRASVRDLIGFHLLPGRYDAADLKRLALRDDVIFTLEGEKIIPRYDGGELSVEDAWGRRLAITDADNEASNGVMHVTSGIPVPAAYP